MYNEQFLINEREVIRRIVKQFDQDAEIFLFGPGIKDYGKKIDIYIKSKYLTTNQQWEIKQKLNIDHFLPHIDMVCGISNERLLANLKFIGLKI